jgi:hypothetical protein
MTATVSSPYALYGGSFGAPGRLDDGLPSLINDFVNIGFVPIPPGAEDEKSKSLRTMTPNIRPELSLVNSIIELKDFISLKHTISNVKKLPKFRFRKGRKLQGVRHLLRVASDVYLQYKFNIAPLISDIRGIYRAVANTEKRLRSLIARSGSVRKSHYKATLNDGTPTVEETSSEHLVQSYHDGNVPWTSYSTVTDYRIVVTDASAFHAELEYNYIYSNYQLEHARVLALLDSLGVNFNPQIVWNAIPWSFVVDWLVDVGQWLGTQRIGLMDPKINIMQYLYSVKKSRRILVSSKVRSARYYAGSGLTGDLPAESITHPVVFETSYRRSVDLPSVSSLTTSGLNPTEFSLGVALVLSRRKRRTGI